MSGNNLTHWRSLVKIKVRIRNGEEIHIVTSKYSDHIQTIKQINYVYEQRPGNPWRIVEDIHVRGVIFPRYRMVVARMAGEKWPKKDENKLKILEPWLKKIIKCYRGR